MLETLNNKTNKRQEQKGLHKTAGEPTEVKTNLTLKTEEEGNWQKLRAELEKLTRLKNGWFNKENAFSFISKMGKG